MREMKGYIVPIFTPFNEDGSVDHGAMRHNISYLIDEGIHGITLTGSFGEFPLLSVQERIDLFEVAADEGAGRCTIIAGTSEASTAVVIEMSEAAASSGCDGLMIVPPPYMLPSERDLANHFGMIAERVSLPITIYNNPPRTGMSMSTGLLLELSKLDRIVSVKQSSQNFFDLLELIRLTADQPGFWVTNGQEHWAFPAMVMGAQAAYGVSPLLIGRECIELYHCAQRDDVQGGRALQLKVNIIRAALRRCDATPAACIRELANMRGLAGGHPRAPITEPSDEDKQILREASTALGITPVAQLV